MNEKIYIFDDQPNTVLPLQLYLEQAEYELELFTRHTLFFERVVSDPPLLILLDVMMPEMDGFEVCQHLKADERTEAIPVIFLTAKTGEDGILKGFEVGGVDYITKPFQQKEVLARVTAHLGLQRQNRQLFHLNKSKDKFFSILTHDLRSPFNALLGYSHCLTDSLRSNASLDQVLHFAQQIQLSSDRFYAVLENLLIWSQMQRGSLAYVPSTLCIDALIQQIIQQFQFQTDFKKISVQFELPPHEILIDADETILRVILQNLLSNAIKFAPIEGNLVITLSQQEHHLQIIVADNGAGIPQEVFPTLFQETEATTGTAGEHGVGIGLALCKSLTDLHNGSLKVESEPGTGTAITFTLKTQA